MPSKQSWVRIDKPFPLDKLPVEVLLKILEYAGEFRKGRRIRISTTSSAACTKQCAAGRPIVARWRKNDVYSRSYMGLPGMLSLKLKI
jgi:hypothetical protein